MTDRGLVATFMVIRLMMKGSRNIEFPPTFVVGQLIELVPSRVIRSQADADGGA